MAKSHLLAEWLSAVEQYETAVPEKEAVHQMRVAARHPGSFDAFLDRLQRSPAFAEALPGDEDRRGEMRATIRARYRASRS